MTCKVMMAAAATAGFAFSAAVLGEQAQFGTAQDARAMLAKTVAAMEADKGKALAMFNASEGGFRDRDLYPFCYNASDGKFVAVGPNATRLLGTDVRALKDPTGKAYGVELYGAAQKANGEIVEVSYMFPRPGGDATPVAKVSFVTKAADLGCAVGYYR